MNENRLNNQKHFQTNTILSKTEIGYCKSMVGYIKNKKKTLPKGIIDVIISLNGWLTFPCVDMNQMVNY